MLMLLASLPLVLALDVGNPSPDVAPAVASAAAGAAGDAEATEVTPAKAKPSLPVAVLDALVGWRGIFPAIPGGMMLGTLGDIAVFIPLVFLLVTAIVPSLTHDGEALGIGYVVVGIAAVLLAAMAALWGVLTLLAGAGVGLSLIPVFISAQE